MITYVGSSVANYQWNEKKSNDSAYDVLNNHLGKVIVEYIPRSDPPLFQVIRIESIRKVKPSESFESIKVLGERLYIGSKYSEKIDSADINKLTKVTDLSVSYVDDRHYEKEIDLAYVYVQEKRNRFRRLSSVINLKDEVGHSEYIEFKETTYKHFGFWQWNQAIFRSGNEEIYEYFDGYLKEYVDVASDFDGKDWDLENFFFDSHKRLGALVLPYSESDNGSSFNCKKAGNKIEKLICSDSRLSELDKKLADLYSAKRKQLSLDYPWLKPYLKSNQMRWLKMRNLECKGKTVRGCLESSYRERIAELHARVAVPGDYLN